MNWIDKEVAFYDFIWAYGVNAHTNCINQELCEDFAAGGNKFEEMKKAILKKFPTRKIALKEFEVESSTLTEDQHGLESDKMEWACSRCGHRNIADNKVCMGTEMGDGQCGKPKPDKVKPLAQYLAEYVQYEGYGHELHCWGTVKWRELLEQALDAYKIDEEVRIKIERV